MTRSAADPDRPNLRLGLTFESSANLFFRDLAEGVREAAATFGAGVVARESGQSVARQRADIAALLNEGIDALVIAPVDSAAMADAMAATYGRGVPVFTVDR